MTDTAEVLGKTREKRLKGMRHVPVTSSNIKTVGYDPALKLLDVAFKSGLAYRYFGVEPEAHKALMAADSKGAHFAKHIKSQHICESL